ARRAVELLRTARRIAEQIECLPRENRRDLVVTVGISGRPRKHGDDDLRPESPDDVEDVPENRVARPEPERFVNGLGVPEVVGAREERAGPGELAGRQELFGTNDPELGAELGADEVL